jgi:ribosomal protein L37AE/L43A
MKKYDCPECGEQLRYMRKLDEYKCDNCGFDYTEKSLEHIDKLKSHLHKMRNCENCANLEHVPGRQFPICKAEDGSSVCIVQDRKHWRMAE